MKKLVGVSGSKVYELIHEDTDGYTLRFIGCPSSVFWTNCKDSYKEYVEPRHISRWVNVWYNRKTKSVTFGEIMYESKSLAQNATKHYRDLWECIDIIEVKWTEK